MIVLLRSSQQEAEPLRQSRQGAIFQGQYFWKAEINCGQSQHKPDMTVLAGSENWRTGLYPVVTYII